MRIIPSGQFLQADFFENDGGLNITDSPFAVRDNQATNGYNYDYGRTGGIVKRAGHTKVNSSPDTQLKSMGLFLFNTSTGSKTVIRAADTKIQSVNLDDGSCTNLTEDTTAASSTFLDSSSTQQVVGSQFNTPSSNTLWLAGGGMSSLFGVYSSTKVTANGVVSPTGALSTSVTATGGSFATTGTYRYAVAFRKTGTQALSNAALDITAVVANTTDKVTVTLTGITNVDTAKFDKIYLYRSAVSGADQFTTGDLVAIITTGTTSYVDTGTFLTSATNVPRAVSLTLDNSQLPSDTYKYITTFKRRLVTAAGSTLYFSDLNKPESWPTLNTITVPSGGDITGLGIISFTTPTTSSLDEFLVIFKERELWVVTGDSLADWSLKFIDSVGCLNQALIVTANGYLTWIDYRGIYLWDGSGKPIYCSRPIESAFQQDGDIDKSKLNLAVGNFYRKESIVIWTLSHKIYGEQCFEIKLDLSVTLPQVQSNLGGRILDGVFTFDYHTFPLYAASSIIPSSDTEERLLAGDGSGYIYKMYDGSSDASAGIDFFYDTKYIDFASPGQAKRFYKVIVWVEEIGSWDLTLDYWANYRNSPTDASTRSIPISLGQNNGAALWDVGFWDVAFWDDFSSKNRPLVFNLDSDNNNNEGDCIKLRLRQGEADAPVTINGFSIIFANLTSRK